MNKYVLLIEYIKEWGLSLALEHYFFGNKYCFLPKGKLEEFQNKLLYNKIDIIRIIPVKLMRQYGNIGMGIQNLKLLNYV